jgi:hypothetical protein
MHRQCYLEDGSSRFLQNVCTHGVLSQYTNILTVNLFNHKRFMDSTVPCDVMQCILVSLYRHFEGISCLRLQGRRVYLENGVARSSETLIKIYNTSRCHIPESSNIIEMNFPYISINVLHAGNYF